jgi:hypothetical protein
MEHGLCTLRFLTTDHGRLTTDKDRLLIRANAVVC